MKFNIGDRVKIIDSESVRENKDFYSLGNTGVIIDNDGWGTFYVEFDAGQAGVRYSTQGGTEDWAVAEESMEKIDG